MQAPINKTEKLNHSITLTNQTGLNISGVIEVLSAQESHVLIKTSFGPLSIIGTELKIKNLLNETHELLMDGQVYEMKYTKAKKGFLKRLFK